MYPIAKQIQYERACHIIENNLWDIRCSSPLDFDVLLRLIKENKITINYEDLSLNLNISLDYILDNLHKDWKWDYLSITFVLIQSNIPIKKILQHSYLPWNWFYISMFNELTISIINNNKHIPWIMSNVLKYANITEEEILKDIDNPIWNWQDLCKNNNISVEFIIKHFAPKTLNLDWYDLSKRVTQDYMLAHPELPWNQYGLASNNNIDIKLIKWDMTSLSLLTISPRISERVTSLQYVLDNQDKPWSWCWLSMNKMICTRDNILANPNLPWNFYTVSHYCDLTYEDVLNSDLPWDRSINGLGTNLSIYKVGDEVCIERAKQLLAANKIKRMWKKCVSNPSYIICKQRLVREFYELNA